MKRVLFSTISFAVGLAVTLICMEAYLQGAEIQLPMETRIDHEIGPAYVNGKHVTRFNEGFYIGAINELGFYGPAVPERADAGEKRVLLLGDSYVMGITLFERHYFGTLLQDSLNSTMAPPIQVLNFGRADFNLWNMYQYYNDFASHWDHDLALFFVGQGDIIPSRQMETDLYPFCYLDGDSLRIDYSFRNSGKYKTYRRMEALVNHSSLFRLAYNTRKMIARGELAGLFLDKFAPPKKGKKKRPQGETGGAKGTDQLPPISMAILKAFSDNPKIMLVVKKDISPDLARQMDQYDIARIDIMGVLDGMEQEGLDPYFWPVSGKKGHWNHETHRRIAAYLHDPLVDALK